MSSTGSNATRPKVLILDDEKMVTESLRMILEMETDYEVKTFQSPRAALAALKAEEFDVVLSDFYMPEMDGLQFLQQVKVLFPEIPRILLTGYADKENAIKGINTVGLFQYIEKPWDNNRLIMIIRNGIANSSLNRTLHKKIRDLDAAKSHVDALARAQNRFKNELQLARDLQSRMLPESFPVSDIFDFTVKFLPAMEIGGDFYNIIPLKNNKYAVLLADITGHGIQAALITILLKFAINAYIDTRTTVAEILRGMNAFLARSLPAGVFVSALLVVIDIKTGDCRFMNAGIPHPVIFSRQRQSVELLPADGLLLGLMDENEYFSGDEIQIDLQEGDCFVAFTDGIAEYAIEKGIQFGDEAMFQIMQDNMQLTTDKIFESILDVLTKHQDLNPNRDDITLLGIERKRKLGDINE
ncbi:MAG: response regulator [Calditrichaeota bacterium]|nr:MAG: response regulator [Calditrichota bacterium]